MADSHSQIRQVKQNGGQSITSKTSKNKMADSQF
jgi:hypothetical protein